MRKLKVYIHSHEIPTVGFVDKEGAKHACAQAQKTAFVRLGQFSSIVGNRYLSEKEREVLMQVERFCKHNNLEFEIVDLGTISILAKLKSKMRKLNTPAINYGEKVLYGVFSEEELRKLVEG